MKKLLIMFIVLITAGCSTKTTIQTGPQIDIAGVAEIALTIDNNGEIHLTGEVAIPTPLHTNLVNVNWLVGFDIAFENAKQTENTLYLLYENGDGQIIQDNYTIAQPFEITFARDEWVRKLKHAGKGNIVVFVEKRQMVTQLTPIVVTRVVAPSQSVSCPSAKYPTRLEANRDARVCTKEDRLIIRRSANMSASEILSIYPGEIIGILEGPVCSDDFWWWKVKIYANTTYGLQEKGYSSLGTTGKDYFGWAREGWDNKDTYFLCQ